jgi:hypothetical protein
MNLIRLRSAHCVNIVKKVKVEDGWNFFPAVVETNGKLKDKVRVRGSVEVQPEGSYYLQWREGKSRFRLPVSEKGDVLELARRKRLALEAQKAGVPLAEAVEEEPAGPTVHEAVTTYLENIKPLTLGALRSSRRDFRHWVSNGYKWV